MTTSADSVATTPLEGELALFRGAGRPFEIRTDLLPELHDSEAIVAVECCTICGSDLHTIGGLRQAAVPTVLGHEVVGTIRSVGDPPPCDIDGKPLRPGERVTWSVSVSCFECDRCLAGFPQKCRSLHKYGHEAAEGNGLFSGGLAEYIVLRRGSTIVRAPNDLPAEIICPANCATATVAAALRVAGEVAGRRVLIFGAGMLGLTAAAMSHARGAGNIVVCDSNPHRLQAAKQFGASATVEWHDDSDAFRRQLAAAGGHSVFDYILEFSGSAAAVERSCEMGDIGARIVLAGTVMPSRPANLDPEQIVRRWLEIRGVHNYLPGDLLAAVEFLKAQHANYPFQQTIAKSFPLSAIDEAVAFANQQRPIRVAVRPGVK